MASGFFSWDDCRRLIAEQNYTAWDLVADEFADRIGDAGYELAPQMFFLLTGMQKLLTLVRMSPADTKAADEKRAELAEVQKAFKTPERLVVGRAVYTMPFGPYYLAITVSQDFLVNNMDSLLSNEPIRYMTVTDCYPNEDFARILRNYRTAQQWRTSMRFRTQPRNVMTVAKAVNEAKLYDQLSLTLSGVFDRHHLITAHFMAAPEVSRGVKLLMGNPPVKVASR